MGSFRSTTFLDKNDQLMNLINACWKTERDIRNMLFC